MGFLPHPRSGNDDEPVAGSAGGPGGPGGSGGSGGRGGVIKLLHCNGSPPRLDAKGGAGGLGGEGGTPGRNGLNGPLQSSPRGARGPNGSHGLDGTAEAVRVGTDLFDFAIRSLLPPDVLQKWADYRVRVGLHYYRSFVDTPETKDYLDRALREFNAALALVPADQQALQFRNMIVANLTVVGLPYDYEIKPDYETFSRAYYEWWDRIQQVRNAATNMVSRIESRNWDALGVARSIAFAEGQREVVKRLTDLAELKLKAAKDRVADATTKRNQILRRINQLETELSMGLYQDSQGRFLGSFFEVISKIAEFADPTAGAVAKIPTYVMPYWFAKDMTPEQRSAFLSDWKQGGKEAKELLEQYKQLAKDASEDGEAGDIIGGLVGVVEQSVKFVDKNVLTSDIRQSQVRDDIKRLAEEAARANFDLADRLLEKHQAELEVGVVEAQNTLWKKDLEIAEELREISENTIKQFTECAELLLRRAQGYFDNLNLLKFWSVRAFDIYTLRETPRWTDFSNGFPHPDVHENSFFLLRRGVGTEATKVLIQLEQVCNDLPTGDLVEELEFERYHSSLGSYEITKRITTPAMISRFRESLEVEFTISAEDLGELLDAIRVDNVQVVLLGATMAVRSTHCILTHLGRMTVRRTRTDVFEQSRRPHSAIVKTVAAMTELSFPEASKFEFFGRSPEAEWRLVLAAKPDDAVNLDGLTEIQIVLDCVGSAR
jgi:tetratricopeptide (TPR) repeat protein